MLSLKCEPKIKAFFKLSRSQKIYPPWIFSSHHPHPRNLLEDVLSQKKELDSERGRFSIQKIGDPFREIKNLQNDGKISGWQLFTRARGPPAQNVAMRHFAQTVTCAVPSYPSNKGLKQERRRHEIEEAENIPVRTAKGISMMKTEGSSRWQLSSGLKRNIWHSKLCIFIFYFHEIKKKLSWEDVKQKINSAYLWV